VRWYTVRRFLTALEANLVDVHRIWRVHGAPREVLAVIRHSHPAGLSINGSGSAGEHAPGEREHEYLWYVTFQARPRPGDEVGNCSPMYFSVNGHEQKPLAKGASVMAIVSQTLGVGLLPR
jgi:hypothetical protein